MTLSLRGIGHSYCGRKVVEGFDLDLAPGEVVALLGPSGSGKTTILQIAAGLIEPAEGSVGRRHARHAVVFQEPRLLPWLTTRDNIAYGLAMTGTARGDRRRIAEATGLEVGLSRRDLDKYPAELSGGMRQRTAVARALAVSPDLVFFDEPFSAVDVGLRRALQDLVIDAAARARFAALFVTHDLAEALRVAHRLVVLSAESRRIRDIRAVTGRPGERSDRAIFDMVESWASDPAFAELYDAERRAAG